MKTLSVLLLALLPSLPAVAARPVPDVVPLSSIPAVSTAAPAAAFDVVGFLTEPVEADRGLKVFGIAAVLIVAVGRLRLRAAHGASR